MTHNSQINGVEQGAARVRHNRPSKGVLEFPLPRDVPKVWFQIFLPKKSDNSLYFKNNICAGNKVYIAEK